MCYRVSANEMIPVVDVLVHNDGRGPKNNTEKTEAHC